MARTPSNDQLKDLIDAAGSVICFSKIIEHLERLEGHADTPDEDRDNKWFVEASRMVLFMQRSAYERARKAFAPNDRIVEALDDLLKECGGSHETD